MAEMDCFERKGSNWKLRRIDSLILHKTYIIQLSISAVYKPLPEKNCLKYAVVIVK